MVGPVTGPADAQRTRSLWFALLLTLANGFLDAHTYLAVTYTHLTLPTNREV